MSTFGDYEAEDAWDATDDAHEHALNLAKRIAALDGLTIPTHDGDHELLSMIEERIDMQRRRRNLTQDDLRHLVQLIEDDRLTRDQLT